MREIKSFDELYQIENDLYSHACSCDLFYIRHAYHLVDGIALVVGPYCSIYLSLFFISNVTVANFTDCELSYIEHYFDIELSYYKKYRNIYKK